MATKPKLGIPVNAGPLVFLDDNPDDYIGDRWIQPSAPAAPAADETSTFRRVVGDGAITALKGAIGVPEAAVGLADIATGGQVGKALENEGGAIGFRPKQAREFLDQFYSPAQQAANRAVQEAANPEDSLPKRILDTGVAAVRNPSTIVHAVGESLPSMAAGGVLARGVMAMAPRMSAYAAAGVGEGAVAAGSGAEQIRQQTPDGLLTPGQAAVAAGSGALTAGLGIVAGKVARSMGIGDIDTMIAGGGGATPQMQKGFVRKLLEGAFTEGVLEELPQSVQEQVAQNYALGKPLDEGVDQAAVMGLLSGGAMGAGAANIGRPVVPNVGPLSRAANEAAATMPPVAPTAPDAPSAPLAPTAPLAPEQEQQMLARANTRLAELDQKAKGTKEKKEGDKIVTPEVPAQLLTPEETKEREFLQQAGGDVQALQRMFGAPAARLSPESTGFVEAFDTLKGGGTSEQLYEGLFGALQAGKDTHAGIKDPVLAKSRKAFEAGQINSAGDLRKYVEAGFPAVASPAAAAQRAADTPALPTETAREGDILNGQGKPFTTMPGAMRAQRQAGDGFEIVPVRNGDRTGLVVRRKPDAVQTAAEATQPAGVAAAAGAEQRADPAGGGGDRAVDAQPPGGNEGVAAAEAGGRDVAAEPVADAGDGAAAVAPTIDTAAHEAAPSPQNDLPEPTDAQKEAGNYKKGHARIGGLDVSIENPAGSTRRGTDRDGKAWENTLQHHYGYFRGTVGNDKDHVDVFVKPETAADYAGPVFVVDQIHPDTGKFDEHKVLMGFADEAEARAAYAANYAPDWKGMQAITAMPFDEFKAWVKDGPKRKPLGKVADAAIPATEPETGKPVSEVDIGNPMSKEIQPLAPAAAPAPERFPPVSTITGMSIGPGGRIDPKPIAEGKLLYRETNLDGLDDLLRLDGQADTRTMFVTDNPDLAIGQGANKGVRVTFRPGALSGREHKKPGTGDIAGREYQTDIVAPRAVQSITLPAGDIKKLRGLTRRALADFDRVENADGTVTLNRKGLDAAPATPASGNSSTPAPAEPPHPNAITRARKARKKPQEPTASPAPAPAPTTAEIALRKRVSVLHSLLECMA